MYDTATRVGLVKKRVRQKRRSQETRALCSLSALCIFLAASLAGMIRAFTGSGHFAAISLYGSISMVQTARRCRLKNRASPGHPVIPRWSWLM